MVNRFPGVVTEMKVSPDRKPKGENKWVGIIIHHTTLSLRNPETAPESDWRGAFAGVTDWLSKKDDNYVSSHFHVGRMGECAQLVDPEFDIAFHAGKSQFWHPTFRRQVNNWNNYAVGIEFLGDGNRPNFQYSNNQYHTGARLVAALMQRYPTISPLCIVGHEMIATPPGRKIDPGVAFSWGYFYRLIYDFMKDDFIRMRKPA